MSSHIPSAPAAEAPPTIKGLSLPTKSETGGEAAAAGESSPGDDIPAWLRELGAGQGANRAGAIPPEPAVDAEDVPDWLRDLRASLPDEPVVGAGFSEASAAPTKAEAPDWLVDLRPEGAVPAAAAEEPVGPVAEEAEVPDWLADLRPEGAAPAAAEEPVGPAAEEAGVPDWLADLHPEGAAPAAAAEGPVAPMAEEAEVPDWLADLRPEEAAPPETEPSPVPTPPPAAAPDWLTELRPTEAEEPAAPLWGEGGDEGERPDWLVPGGAEGDESLARAEIPDWLLALKPRELRAEGEEPGPEPDAEEAAEETGLLAGIPGVLPVEMIIAQPRAAAEPPPVTATGDLHQARLFAQVVGQTAEAQPIPLPEKGRGPLSRLTRWLLYLLLLAAVAGPLVIGRPLLPRTIEPTAPVQALYDRIERLPADATVVVAFDYDPSSSDEMNLVAQVLLNHLMDRRARIVIVSLLPAGPATAQSLLADLTAAHPAYADGYGRRVVNLGYMPGQAAAVRLFGDSVGRSFPRDFTGTPLAELPIMDGLTDAADFDLVVELTANQEHLRWWIEQVGAPRQVEMVGGVSAQIEPLALAYHATDPPQLIGVVGGVPGAARYETLRDQDPQGGAAVQMDAQLAGHGLLVLVILLGGVVYLAQRARGRED